MVLYFAVWSFPCDPRAFLLILICLSRKHLHLFFVLVLYLRSISSTWIVILSVIMREVSQEGRYEKFMRPYLPTSPLCSTHNECTFNYFQPPLQIFLERPLRLYQEFPSHAKISTSVITTRSKRLKTVCNCLNILVRLTYERGHAHHFSSECETVSCKFSTVSASRWIAWISDDYFESLLPWGSKNDSK